MVRENQRLDMYLERILEAIKKIEFHTKDVDISDLENHRTQFDGCLMQLIHIGETANKINKMFPKFDLLPIIRMISLRNFAAHDYLGVNANIVKSVIKNDLPQIKKLILEWRSKGQNIVIEK